MPEKAAKETAEDRRLGPREVKFAKTSRSTGRREVKTLRVLGNERLTRGGTVKRAKPKMTSVKKTGRD